MGLPSATILFMAHPGHELVIHGWLSRARPVVHVLTDGSGHTASGRIPFTRDLLRSLAAPEGGIFGRFADRDVYAAILGRDVAFVTRLVTELADDLVASRATGVVADAAEGYNPVHDMCRTIVGAACDVARRAGAGVRHYEYAVVEAPDSLGGAAQSYELDDAAFAAKIGAARRLAPHLADVDEMLARVGEASFRREVFREVDDWTAAPAGGDAPPRYERFGEERVAAGLYSRVIRYREHMAPLRDAVRDWVESTQCVF